MQSTTVEWLARACCGKLRGASPKTKVSGLCIDSRKVLPGDCFVALPGTKTDGQAFVLPAFAAGAAVCLCRQAVPGVPCIVVKNPGRALGEAAAAYRRRFKSLRVVGITGSSGKTTVKEMTVAVLSAKFKVHATRGNLNNELGVPLTLAGLERTHTAAVVEMGMNHAGEIRRLAKMAQPRVGVITNIGDAHAGHFKDRRALAGAKAELLEALPKQGMAVLNLDDPLLASRALKRRLTFGWHENADVRIGGVRVQLNGTRVVLLHRGQTCVIGLKAYGAHQAGNAAAAVAAGIALGMSFATACRALEGFRPVAAMRSQLVRLGPHRVIHDAYNSNPQSAAAAIRLLAGLPARGRKIMVAGSMLELGRGTRAAHVALGREASVNGVQVLITVGKEARAMQTGARGIGLKAHADTAAGVIKILSRWLSKSGDLILVKGSRGVGLERVVEDLQKYKSGSPQRRKVRQGKA